MLSVSESVAQIRTMNAKKVLAPKAPKAQAQSQALQSQAQAQALQAHVCQLEREVAELKEAVADAHRSQRESYAALTQQNAMMQSMLMQLMHFSMRAPPPASAPAKALAVVSTPAASSMPGGLSAPAAMAPVAMADERFPRRTYDEFKDAMEEEMEVTDAQLHALQSDYAGGLAAVLAAHVRRQLSAEHVAPLKNCAKRPELMAWRAAADGVNRGWVKMGEGDVEMLCKRVMKVMLKHNREGVATKKATRSQISDQVALTGYISEGITKSKFKREAARHIYDQLIGL